MRVVGSNLRTTTDSSGNYRLPYVPGKFRVVIEKEGHDSEEIDLDLAQATNYPLEDKHLTPVPRSAGLYFQGELDWQATSACVVELAEGNGMDLMRARVTRFAVRGEASLVVHDGTAYFLDLAGAEQVVLLPVAADGTILRIVRERSLETRSMMYGGQDSPEFAEVAIPLKRDQIGRGRTAFSANLKPGIYALVSRQPSLLPYNHVALGPTCYMFELRSARQAEEAAAGAQQPIEEVLTEAETWALTVGDVNVGEELRDIVQNTQGALEGIIDAGLPRRRCRGSTTSTPNYRSAQLPSISCPRTPRRCSQTCWAIRSRS